MSRQKIGCRKKSIHASQYRVGRYGCTTLAAFSVTSISLMTSAASEPERGADRGVGERGQEDRDRRDAEHRDGDERHGAEDALDQLKGGQRRAGQRRDGRAGLQPGRGRAAGARRDRTGETAGRGADGRRAGRAEDQHAGGVRGHRDHNDGEQRERDDRDELGDQQLGPAYRTGQQVAQRARRSLARDRVARHHRDGDRQEHRQHEGQCRRRDKAARRRARPRGTRCPARAAAPGA